MTNIATASRICRGPERHRCAHWTRSSTTGLLALVLALPAPVLAARPSRTATVWVASATEKIAANAPARPTFTNAKISAARNEFEAFQVIVTGTARGVTARATALTQPSGAAITDVRLYQAALMNVTQPSAPDSVTGKIPDALIPHVDEMANERRNAFPFDARSGESRAIWVEVFVPKTAAPGLYTGSVTVTHSRGQATVPVELEVWNFELPSTSSVRSAFGLSWGELPAGHGFSASDVTTFATMRQRYGQFALDHRLTLSRFDDGNWADLAHFERYFGPLMNGTAGTRLVGARLTAVEYLGDLTSTANMSRWATFYKARGWFDRLFQYTCDEPPHQGCGWPEIATRANAAKAADPSFRTLVTTTIQEAASHGATSYLDLIVPVINFMDDKSGTYVGNQRHHYDGFLAAESINELWLYQSCMSHGCGGSSTYDTGWPSYMIDASAVRNRAMQWLLFRYGATGELYWDTAFAYQSGDPWVSQWAFSGHGDGTLFYPGTPAKIGGSTHIPVASIRLKMIREGMEDYEYLKRVAALGDPGFARAIADALFPTAYSTGARSAADVMSARQQLALRILQLQGTP